jgi:anti-sigma factor RsiW
MASDDWAAKLDVYLDGELTAEEMRAFDAHLRSCPSCTAELSARVQLKRMVQSSGRRFAPTPEFRRKILSATNKRRRIWHWALAMAAALVLVALTLTYVGQQRARTAEIFSEVADLHVQTLASTNPVDVVSSDRHTVKPWFQGKIPFSFNLPELQNSEFTLIGGRVTYIHQVPGAHLIYEIRKHRISAFIIQENDGTLGRRASSKVEQKLSFNQQTWREGELRFFLVGDAASQDISRLADLLKAAQQQ